MTTMGKTLLVILSLGALFGATLALRGDPTPPPPARLTPAQMAEAQPAPKPADPPKASAPASSAAEERAEPPEPDLEDGSGS